LDDDEFAESAAKIKRDIWPSTVVDLCLGRSNAEQIDSAALAAKDDTASTPAKPISSWATTKAIAAIL